jgi:malate dehydrogenase (oxaloacetate-decarboxylating)
MPSTAAEPDDLAKHVFLANMRDRKEVLFRRLLTEHLDEMLPILYTPTVGMWICCWPPTPNAPSASATRVGGIDIAIGKLAVYIAAAGLHPRSGISVVLDMGTDNLRLLNDEMYIGNARVRDQRYDDLLDAYGDQTVPARPVAWGGLRRQQRPAHPEHVHIGGVHVLTTTCRGQRP